MENVSEDEMMIIETAKRLDKEKREMQINATAEQVAEYEKKKQEDDRKLYARAHQLRALALSSDPKFFEIGKDELELLKRYFPEDAKRLAEKLEKAKQQDKKRPGSVDRTNLLIEIEGLASKAFKVMLENIKMDKKRMLEARARENEKRKSEITPKMQSEVENERGLEPKAMKEPEETSKYVLREKSDGIIGGAVKGVKENLEDGYTEGKTGKKVERQEEKQYEVVEVREKSQEKQKPEKSHKKGKPEKVASVSMEEIRKEQEKMNGSSGNSSNGLSQEEIERRLKNYNKKTQERAEQNQSKQQSEPSNGMQMMPRGYKKN